MAVETKPEETQFLQEQSPVKSKETQFLQEQSPVKSKETVAAMVERETECEPDSDPLMAEVEKSSSFKEESSFLSDLKESERKALLDLRAMVETELFKQTEREQEEKGKEKEISEETKEKEEERDETQQNKEVVEKEEREEKEEEKDETQVKEEEEEREKKEEEKDETQEKEEEERENGEREIISLWGVLLSAGDESTDVLLLKFLRARDFKAREAFEMLSKTLQWRKENRIDTILDEEELGKGIDSICFTEGRDRDGHPVCYNVLGLLMEGGTEEGGKRVFESEEGRERLVRWRVQVMENGVKSLELRPGGVGSITQVIDMKDAPGPGRKDVRTVVKKVVEVLQDNYPELVARNIFINVPFWYCALNALLSPFLTQRTKSKFVLARPSMATETLLKYIPAEAIPVKYGGLKREDDIEFSMGDGVSEITIKPNSVETIEIPATEAGATLVWDLTVIGWEVNYKEEFVPNDEGSYTIIVKKGRKMSCNEEPVRTSFRTSEPGKVVLSIDNNTFKKKKVLFRHKAKKSSPF